MNRVILMGRLTDDPKTQTTQSGMEVARFTLAINRMKTKDNQDPGADFPSCVAFGKTAETIGNYLHKGNLVVVEGRLQTGSYTGQDGVKRYTTDVIVDRFEFCERKAEGQQAPEPSTDSDGFMNIPDGIDEELPFN